MSGILIAGTSSDAGKSLVVTGICRALRRRGIDVAPYKAQNMSNNSMVCADGTEIGRAQYLQAQAAQVEPSTLMNPVLLKPGSDRTSHVVLRGRPAGELRAGEYAHDRKHLAEAAWEAYRELEAAHELIVCEGAGSPAEINLRTGDYTNMGLAQAVDLPVVLVGDIDRGGVLASLYGTWAIVDDADRARLKGYIINKFRGDQSVLDPGLDEITRRTGMANFGVLPWIQGAWLDGEDTLEVGRWRHDFAVPELVEGTSLHRALRVAVVRLPRISNATDVDALAHEPGVDVYVTQSADACRDADLVVLPGSRSTLHDLAWLRETGIADVVTARHAAGRPVLGICGGYQMLGHHIADGIESGEQGTGLGLLPHDTVFSQEKILARPKGQWRGIDVEGYEIHHGTPVAISADTEPPIPVPEPPVPVTEPVEVTTGGFDKLSHRNGALSHRNTEPFLDGTRVGHTFGTMWHGALECDDFRRAFLTEIAGLTGSTWTPGDEAMGYQARREAMIDQLADAMEAHVDLDALLSLALPRS